MSNFAHEERELEEREFEEESWFASHCRTYDELREVRMGIVPRAVIDRARAALTADPETAEIIESLDRGDAPCGGRDDD